jgi:murein DD-endopeptidase MepM/ murein hydrolase activator NlpD
VVRKRNRILLATLVALVVLFLLPEWPRVPVAGATAPDWNRASFWYEPWGVSGVHKGIDIFAEKGTPVVAPTYGLVLFRGDIALGGRVVAMLV